MAATLTDTPLGRTIAETATDIWNDSCNVDELAYAVGFGAVGATANPTIVVDNWRKDPDHVGHAGARSWRAESPRGRSASWRGGSWPR